MAFGQRLRELRKGKKLGLRALAERVGIIFTYLNKTEKKRFDFAQSEKELIRRLAKAFDAEVNDLVRLPEKVPEHIRRRVMERPSPFLKIVL